jgi:hypothetical protein
VGALAEMNAFLRSHRVLSVERRWVERRTNSFWCFCVDYVDAASSSGAGASRRGQNRQSKVDYKEVLKSEDFAVYARLRELGKAIAETEKVPVYTILNNEQLARMVQSRATTKAALDKIGGVGDARVDWYGRKLSTGNPNVGNLGADFNRYLFDFWPAVVALDSTHVARQHRFAMLNAWRNAIAHHNYDPAELGGTTTLTIAQVRDWRADCDLFATAFDTIARNQLQATTGVSPWPP